MDSKTKHELKEILIGAISIGTLSAINDGNLYREYLSHSEAKKALIAYFWGMGDYYAQSVVGLGKDDMSVFGLEIFMDGLKFKGKEVADAFLMGMTLTNSNAGVKWMRFGAGGWKNYIENGNKSDLTPSVVQGLRLHLDALIESNLPFEEYKGLDS